jgi:hypothetical protein
MKMPNLGEAHCGEGALQSQQTLLLDSLCKVASYGQDGVSTSLTGASGEGQVTRTLDRVSGSTSHMALEAIAGDSTGVAS